MSLACSDLKDVCLIWLSKLILTLTPRRVIVQTIKLKKETRTPRARVPLIMNELTDQTFMISASFFS